MTDKILEKEEAVAAATIPDKGIFRSIFTLLPLDEVSSRIRHKILTDRGVYPELISDPGKDTLYLGSTPIIRILPMSGGFLVEYLTKAEFVYDVAGAIPLD